MKKIIYIAVCYFIGIGMVVAQPVTTFNKLYPAIGTSATLPTANNTYCVPLVITDTFPYRALSLVKINQNGIEQNRDTLRFRSYSTIENQLGLYVFQKTFDDNTVMANSIQWNCSECVEGCLIKFNNSMTDTLWTKTYKFQGYNTLFTRVVENSLSHCLYTIGQIKINGDYPFVFSCFDANGNLLWEKKHDRIPNVMEYILDIAVVGNYLVISGQNAFTGNSGSYTATYDLNGNYLHQQTINGIYTETGAYLLPLNSQEVLGIIMEGTGPYLNSNYDFESRILLQRINVMTNTVLQNKYIGINDKNVFAQKPTFLDNNKIVFAGSRWDANRNAVSGIYAINTNLDSLWYREYPNEIEPQNYIFWSQDARIYNTMVSNGSIFTAGEFFTDNTPTAFPVGSPSQYAWVMKLDTAGCLTPGCWTSVTDKTPDIWIADNPLGLYPNPAHTQITLRLPDAPNAYQIDIFDAHGKRMFEEPRMAADCTISTVGFPSGTYFCRATYAGKRLGMAKFVVAQ